MTDAEVAAQIARTGPFIAKFRELVATTTTDPTSPCAAAHRRELERICETLDAVDYVYFANLANLNAAMRGELLGLVEVQLKCVGGGPTLDFAGASAFLASNRAPAATHGPDPQRDMDLLTTRY